MMFNTHRRTQFLKPAYLLRVCKKITGFTVEGLTILRAHETEARWKRLRSKLIGLPLGLRKTGWPRFSAIRACK